MKQFRRRPGKKHLEKIEWPKEEEIKDLGDFGAQIYLQKMIRCDPSRVTDICKVPQGINDNLWRYENMRQFITELNQLVVALNGICTCQTCPKMKSTDVWLYLCASHKTPQSCSAIDYMIHQLDHSSNILNDSKNFDKRFEIKDSQIKYLESISRRIYRLFSHTFFHHNEVFQQFESKTFLCARFTHFTTEHSLLSQDQFIIPKDAKPPGGGAPAAEEGSKESIEAPTSKPAANVDLPAAASSSEAEDKKEGKVEEDLKDASKKDEEKDKDGDTPGGDAQPENK